MLVTQKTKLSERVSFTHVKTDKFKTGCFSVNFITKLSRETAAPGALIMSVLSRGTERYPDMESIAKELDTLYGARIEPVLRKKGELQCIGLCCDFADDKYVPGGEKVLEPVVGLLSEMLFHPCLKDALLRSDYVTSERRILVDDIRAAINDKRSYAAERLLGKMCAKEAYGISKLGTENTAKRISARSLTAYYRELLRTSKVEIFYCGSADFARVESAVKYILNELPDGHVPEDLSTDVLFTPHAGSTRRYSDVLDVNQGKLSIGFRLGETMKNLDIPAVMVFNAVYGGSVTSKLFMNVREKLSLCYYASSSIDKHKGVMLVNSGVNFEDFGKAQREILKQLKSVATGDISDYELDAARRYVVTALRSTLDRPFGMEEYYFDTSISGHDLSPDDIADRCSIVKKEQIAEIAGSILLDSVYCLKGGAPVGA